VRKHLGFSVQEWNELPVTTADMYWDHMLDDHSLFADPDSEEGWDGWEDDPNVVQ
jgi:hypothetical protein